MVHVMSEVKRYLYTYDCDTGASLFCEQADVVAIEGELFVLLSDFDAQRLRADTAEAELKELEEAVVWALPGTRFMDPPDGGSPTLGEQVGRMAEALAAAEQRIADLYSTSAIDAAAKKLAECMDYPWGHMPEKGRASMRDHAKSIICAALNPKPEAGSHED